MNGEISTESQPDNVNAPAPIAGVVASFQSSAEAQQPTPAQTAGTTEMRKLTTTDDPRYSIHIPTMAGHLWITHVGPPIDIDPNPVLAATNLQRDAGRWPKAQAEEYLKAARTHWITATLGRAV